MIDGTFRLNPAVELVVFDRLDAAVQGQFAALTRDPTFYGVLVTPTTAKAVDRDSALLLLTLRAPGAIPQYAVRALGDRAPRTIAGWVLDGILEIEHGGAWLSGPAAVSAVGAAEPGEGVIGRLSIDALRYAAALPTRDASALARRLYRFNHLPLSPRALRAYQAETDETRFGLATPRAAEGLARGWSPLPSAGAMWASWLARGVDERGGYKLYVSPAPHAVRDVLPTVAARAASLRAWAMKVGRGPAGLLRPDKMVIYFSRRDDLHAAAATLAEAMAGVPSHGVPFTAAVTDDGLLSWGVDPADDDGMASLLRVESWRERLTNHMAVALASVPRADHPGAIDDAVAYVLARLETHGVDVRTWSLAA